MINFKVYSDEKLIDFIKSVDFKELEDQELISLREELTKSWGRKIIAVPLSLVREIHVRYVNKNIVQ